MRHACLPELDFARDAFGQRLQWLVVRESARPSGSRQRESKNTATLESWPALALDRWDRCMQQCQDRWQVSLPTVRSLRLIPRWQPTRAFAVKLLCFPLGQGRIAAKPWVERLSGRFWRRGGTQKRSKASGTRVQTAVSRLERRREATGRAIFGRGYRHQRPPGSHKRRQSALRHAETAQLARPLAAREDAGGLRAELSAGARARLPAPNGRRCPAKSGCRPRVRL